MAKQASDSDLPRREPGQAMPVVEHQHPGSDKPHKHRMGQIPHDHDENGRPVVSADAKFVPASADDKTIDLTAEAEREMAERRVAALKAEAAEIAERRPDLIQSSDPLRPVSLSGAPGSRLADVSSFSSTLTLFGIPAELQDELTWAQIAKHGLDSMIEEVLRTRQPSDPALVSAVMDAVMHLGKARGLA